MHSIDFAVREHPLIGQLVIRSDIENMNVSLAGRSGAGDVQLLEIGREAQAVGVGHLVVCNHYIQASTRIPAIDLGRQLLFGIADAHRLTDTVVELALRVALAASGIRRSFIQLRAIRRIREPDAAIRVRHHVVRGVEALAFVGVCEQGNGTVELVAHHAAGQMLAGELPPLVVEHVAVTVVRRHPEHGDAAVVLDPAHLSAPWNIAPEQVASL